MNGTTIDAARYNGLTNDVATGITACLAKNGENVPTANLPMGGLKHTGAAAGAASGEYLIYAQTIVGAAGAAATPGFAFTGDLNNGWWAPAADTQAWSVSGTEYMRLTSTQWTLQTNAVLSNGGTARRTLQFTNTGGDLYAGIENSTGGGVFTGSSAYAGILGTANATALQFATNGTVRATFSSAGNFGVGIAPTVRLQMKGDAFQYEPAANTNNIQIRIAGGSSDLIQIGPTAAGTITSLTLGMGALNNALGSAWVSYPDGRLDFLGLSGASRLSITADGRLYGAALHNNAGAVTGTTNQYIASGTYTPTLTSVSNVSATTSNGAQWTRTGNVVTVSGSLAIDPTSTNTFTEVGISLPIASNFTQTYHCAGTAVGALLTSNPAGTVAADTTNDRASLTFTIGTDVTNNNWFFTFTYLIL